MGEAMVSGSASRALLVVSAGLLLIVVIILLIVLACRKKTPAAAPESEFDGSTLGYWGYHFLAGLVTLLTLGIAYPWMHCMLLRWQARHTTVCGKRMCFDGKGLHLIGRYLLWGLLTVVTLGIYGLWMGVNIKKWQTKHTHFQGEPDNNSYFDGGVLGFFGIRLLAGLLTLVTLGIGTAWAQRLIIRWETNHTVIDSRRLVFQGTGGSLFGKYLLWGILSVITLGIYSLCVPVRALRWQMRNTIDHEHTQQALLRAVDHQNRIRSDAVNGKTMRMETEMEAMRAGVNDSVSTDDLRAMAQKGNAAAAYAYVLRCTAEDDGWRDFLKQAAEAGIPGAMYRYSTREQTLSPQEQAQLVEKAAGKGHLEALHAQFALCSQAALPDGSQEQLQQALYCYELLAETPDPVTEEETQDYRQCCMLRRRREAASVVGGSSGSLWALLLIPLVLLVVLGAAVGIFQLLRKAEPVHAPVKTPMGFTAVSPQRLSGSGTAEAPYKIGSPAALAELMHRTQSTGEVAFYEITEDLTISDMVYVDMSGISLEGSVSFSPDSVTQFTEAQVRSFLSETLKRGLGSFRQEGLTVTFETLSAEFPRDAFVQGEFGEDPSVAPGGSAEATPDVPPATQEKEWDQVGSELLGHWYSLSTQEGSDRLYIHNWCFTTEGTVTSTGMEYMPWDKTYGGKPEITVGGIGYVIVGGGDYGVSTYTMEEKPGSLVLSCHQEFDGQNPARDFTLEIFFIETDLIQIGKTYYMRSADYQDVVQAYHDRFGIIQ